MKKFLLSLIAVLTLSLSAVAETVTYPESTETGWAAYSWTQDGDDFTATVGDFTFLLAKNTSTNALVAPDKYSIRVYAGANLTITAPTGYVMTEVSGLTASSSKAVGTTVSEGWTNETGTISAAANQPFKFTCADGLATITFDGNGKQLRVKEVTVTYQSATGETKAAANLSFPESHYTAKLGEAFTAPTLTKDTDAAVTYSSSDPEVATVDATGAVTLVAAGSTVITAEAAENDNFYGGKASYTLEVVDPNIPGATIDNPMTVLEALEACTASGPKGVYVKGVVKAVTTEYSAQYKNVTFTIIDTADDAEVLECFRAKWGEGVTGPEDNNPAVGATVVMYGDLTIYNGKKELNSGNLIVKYEAPALPSAGLSFPEALYSINLGETFTAPELTKDTPAVVSYASSIPAVAEVDAATGAVTVKTYGTTVITASTEGTSAFLPGEASYTLEVLNPEITVDAPLTVEQALAVCENNPHKVFVKGYVIEVTTQYDSKYMNVTFTIADTKEGGNVLTCYRSKWGEGVTAPEDYNPAVGASVIISGDLKVYNDMKEFEAGNLIVKYDNSTDAIESVEFDANAPVEYFNLQGVRVNNPEGGMFIMRQGSKVAKVIR